MRQVVIPRHGPPEVLEGREAPDPVPAPGEARVRPQAHRTFPFERAAGAHARLRARRATGKEALVA